MSKNLTTAENRAVSPVVGVVLLAAIVVVIAAVAGIFFLQMADSSLVAPEIGTSDEEEETVDAPDVDFTFDYDPIRRQTIVTHAGGDDVDAENLEIRGAEVRNDWNSNPVTEGDSATVGGTDVEVVWTGGDEDLTIAVYDR